MLKNSLFGDCVLLLWVVRAQHVQYERECEIRSRDVYVPLHCKKNGQGKNNKLNFLSLEMACLGPLFGPKIPLKKFMWVPFAVLSQEMRHTNFFFSGDCLGWGQKVYVEKVYVLVLSPTEESAKNYQIQGPKKNPKAPQNRTNSSKDFLKESQALPNKTRALRQIVPDCSPKSSSNSCRTSSLLDRFHAQSFPYIRIVVLDLRALVTLRHLA